ncbi:MAG: hypothetical protein HC831_22385 [Chloroflexia bacterium]|nr:hypothetical protein [Chloroflexia bacterium]
MYDKNTFRIIYQKGRLEIAYYESEWGSWKIDGERLILDSDKENLNLKDWVTKW